MGILLVVAAALIQLFDLEEGTNLSTTQRIAGYFVIILICLFMASFVLSFGYIYITAIHCMIINKEQIKFEHIERVRGLLSVRYILCKSEVGHYYDNLWNIMNFLLHYRYWCSFGPAWVVEWYGLHGRSGTCSSLFSTANLGDVLSLCWNVLLGFPSCPPLDTRDKGDKQ